MKSLVLFRRDLRLTDNSALSHAARDATEGVIGLYCVTPRQWEEHDEADCKIDFWMQNLRLLSRDLAQRRVPLLIETCDTYHEIPRIVVSVARQHECRGLYFNYEYEVNETRRDEEIESQCAASGIAVHGFHDRVIVPPREISTRDGRFYSVFTPYRRVWNTRALEYVEAFPTLGKQRAIELSPSPIPNEVPGFRLSRDNDHLWPAGEPESQRRLAEFAQRIMQYDDTRDIPSVEGTSQLSPYLAAGVISPRQCLALALSVSGGKLQGYQGVTTWISELTWRDFYTHVLVGFPRVSMHQPFKQSTNAIRWQTGDPEFEAWRLGRTGYPIVDAGMRQLNELGWMHNRLRMVTAMFLTKHLLVDWRRGERYFMQRLIDGDLAANNGGWQWSASTGTDAVPYFRIFNPFSQSKRFDPAGKFIRQFCPELSELPPATLHDAHKLSTAIDERKIRYPSLIVDHKFARERALKRFQDLSPR